MHGGRLWVDNDAGGGSQFHFTLRAADAPMTVAATPKVA
jgi:signal transduction histidine kinase